MKSRMIALGAVLLNAAACQQPATAPHDVQVRVQTEGTTFAWDAAAGSAGVPFTVENLGSSTIHLARCGEHLMMALDRREGGQWVQHSGDSCQAIHAMDPLPLAPAASLSGVRQVLEPGRYRLRSGVGSKAGESSDWTTGVSNEFTVE